jgi:hypothetical protein
LSWLVRNVFVTTGRAALFCYAELLEFGPIRQLFTGSGNNSAEEDISGRFG